MEYIILILLWISYCVLHSILISTTATEFLKRKLKKAYKYYRLFYNIIALVTLIPVMIYTDSINGDSVIIWSGYLFIPQYFLLSVSIMLIISALFNYDLLQFIGFRQIFNNRTHRVLSTSGMIKENGVMGLVRHPLYSAVFILLWARDLSIVSILMNIVLSGYLIIGTLLEEKKLVAELGNEYKDYKNRVSMFFPFKWMKTKIFN